MGSIININTNPKNWAIIDDTKPLILKDTGEELYRVCIGVGDYDYSGQDDITLFIRKKIYDKLIGGEYRVRRNQIRLVVEDKNGNIVEPYFENGENIY